MDERNQATTYGRLPGDCTCHVYHDDFGYHGPWCVSTCQRLDIARAIISGQGWIRFHDFRVSDYTLMIPLSHQAEIATCQEIASLLPRYKRQDRVMPDEIYGVRVLIDPGSTYGVPTLIAESHDGTETFMVKYHDTCPEVKGGRVVGPGIEVSDGN